MGATLVLVLVGLGFDFTNGFHDSANAMATSIATGALKPRVAVGISAVLNFAGAFISIEVAATIAKGIVSPTVLVGGDGLTLVLAALIGAMTWNIITWYFSLPSSSSHALIGGVIGAGLGKKLDSVHWSVFGKMASGWVLTIPAAGVMGGVAWAISNAFGKNSSVGALVIVALALAAAFVLWLLAQRSKVTPDELDRTQAGSAGPPPAVAAAGVAA